jgi:hypothetical protein
MPGCDGCRNTQVEPLSPVVERDGRIDIGFKPPSS